MKILGWAINTCSMMSGKGLGGMGMKFWMAWIGIAILAILIMLGKKWLGEEEVISMPYNWFGSILGVIAYVFVITFTCSTKIALVVVLFGVIGGGYLAGITIGEAD